MPTMKVHLGPFARTGLEARHGTDIEPAVHAALGRYHEMVEAGAPLAPPRFLAQAGPEDPAAVALELTLAPAVETTLERQAALHGVEAGRLAAHAVFIYMAERDRLP